MKPNRSKLRFTLLLALLLGAAAVPMTVVPTFAYDENTDWSYITTWTTKDGNTAVMYLDKDSGTLMVEIWNKDGSLEVYIHGPAKKLGGSGDPGPDDPSSKGTGIEPK